MDPPYTRNELANLEIDAKPTRGRYCPKCKAHIPEFADLSPQMADELKRMDTMRAIKTIRETTSCPLS